MKKTLPALLTVLFAFNANAQDAPLYHFTDELKNAAKNCSPYEEDFSATNPTLKAITKFFGLDDLSTFIHINGKNDKGNCSFSIISKMDDITVSNQLCTVSSEQLAEIYDAMTDTSGKKVTKTFTTNINFPKPDGTTEKKSMETTVTDTKPNIVWKKFSEGQCENIKINFSEQDMQRLQRKTFALPADFVESLKVCRPAKAEKSIMLTAMTAEITGVKNGYCQIKMPPFEFSLNRTQTQSIETWMDFYSFAENPAIAKYVPEYSTVGLSGAVKACALDKETYDAGSEKTSFEGVKLAKGISSAFSDDVCTITFTNTVEIKGKTSDHSKICKISKAKLKELLPLDLEKEKKEGFFIAFPFSEEERKLSNELYEKLKRSSLCK